MFYIKMKMNKMELNKMNMVQLRAFAKEYKLIRYSRLRKAELINLIDETLYKDEPPKDETLVPKEQPKDALSKRQLKKPLSYPKSLRA